ncbi:hypothetical protein QE152_g8232 [Popillia japonica]|uniref:Uncharacterized protein n=1 Tax=Popillia japonica TaxID=7064 RepID=A0AAW1M5F4_POPJA
MLENESDEEYLEDADLETEDQEGDSQHFADEEYLEDADLETEDQEGDSQHFVGKDGTKWAKKSLRSPLQISAKISNRTMYANARV